LHPQPLDLENSVSLFVIPLQKSQKVGTVLGDSQINGVYHPVNTIKHEKATSHPRHHRPFTGHCAARF
jgi:hypothetical protein